MTSQIYTQNPVRVLLCSPSLSHQGGVANYTRLLLKNAPAQLVCFAHVAVGKAQPSSPLWRRPFEYMSSVWRFMHAVRQKKPDVVHLSPSLTWTSLPLNLVLLLLSRFICKDKPVVLFFRGWRDEVALSMVNRKKLSGILLTRLLAQADYFIVLSDKFRCQLIEAGFHSQQIFVSPVMVDTRSLQSTQNYQNSTINGTKSFHVLFLSRLIREKGLPELVQAIKWLQEKYSPLPVQFIIAGDGPESAWLALSLAPEVQKGIVQLPGYLSGQAKWDVYQKADLFVFPSYQEGFPTAVVEALAAGLPIIYTPVGALAETLGPDNGIRIELGDLSGKTLGRAIWQLYLDQPLRQTMSQTNLQIARRYDVNTVSTQMATIYHTILNTGVSLNDEQL